MALGTIYNTSTGEILRNLDMVEEYFIDQVQSGESLYNDYADPNLMYFISNLPVFKNTNPSTIDTTTITANGSSTATISSIPNPSTAFFTVPEGANPIDSTTIIDGTIAFSCNTIGEYTITLSSIPHLTETFTITAS